MKSIRFVTGLSLILALYCACSTNKKMKSTTLVNNDSLLHTLLKTDPAFDTLLLDPGLNIQIIYTQIDRDKDGAPQFTDHHFRVNRQQYYYPASTVKFPIAVLALQRLHELNIKGLDMNTTMITGVADSVQTAVLNDPDTKDGPPTVAGYIRKILLVSDNDASNRLYEFLGQEYINEELHKRGYDDVQIIHRLSIALNEEQNRKTNPISFRDTAGNIIYEQAAKTSQLKYATRNDKLGKGYMKNDELIHEPFDFSMKNRLPLEDLHSIVRAVLFPNTVPPSKQFNLQAADYELLYKYMSMYPRESDYPSYDTIEFKDNAAKMFVFTPENSADRNRVRIFSKAGWAYGFLTDAAYIIDPENQVEWMVSATIYCNSDGIFNDDKYDFETLGYPFFRKLGRLLYEYELKRTKKYKPDLSSFEFIYSK